MEYQDVVYFGYDHGKEGIESSRLQAEFMEEVKKVFPVVEFKNAYDSIKGFRQEVYLPKTESDNYFSFLIGKQWFELSLMMQLMLLSKEKEHKDEFNRLFELAKKQYPESFKKEFL